jgi:RNA polymerase sigma-70 factor (ECF subfamily)
MLFFLIVLTNEEQDIIKALYESEHIKMYAIAMKILQHPEDAEEAVQEAFLRISDKIERIMKLSCPERVPFCVVIVKNVSKNMRRDQKPSVNIDDIDHLLFDTDSDPQQDFFANADSKYLGQCLKELSPQDRDVILMKWGKDMGYRKIGEALGINEETAKKRGQRALKQLRSIYLRGDFN